MVTSPPRSPFEGPLRIATWNSRALFTSYVPYHKARVHFITQLASYNDIIMIQETHDNEVKTDILLHTLKEDFDLYPSYDPDRTAAGGCLILIAKKFTKCHFTNSIHLNHIQGRLHSVHLLSDFHHLHVVNIHLDPNLPLQEARRTISSIKDLTDHEYDKRFVVAGDFNFVLDPQDRHHDFSSDHHRCALDSLATTWNEQLGFLAEMYQPNYTRFATIGMNSDLPTPTASRIDRIYANIHPDEEFQFDISTSLEFPPLVDNKHVSDHATVSVRISRITQRTVHLPPPIPTWIFSHPDFISTFESAALEYDLKSCTVWNALLLVKGIFRDTAKTILDATKNRPPVTDQEKIYITISAIKTFTDKHKGISRLDSLIKQYPELLKDNTIHGTRRHLASLRTHLQALLIKSSINDIAIPSDAGDQPDVPNLPSRKNDAHSKMRKLAPTSRALGISAIIDPSDSTHHDSESAAKILCDYWSDIFTEKLTDERKAFNILQQFALPYPDTNFYPDFKSFDTTINCTNNSAPGPDGIPYIAWRASPVWVRQLLYRAFIHLMSGRNLPEDFNHAFLWLLPKGDDPADSRRCLRHPRDTRPLSGSNTDGKIFASAIDFAFHQHIHSYAHHSQRGFIHGRHLQANIIDIDGNFRYNHIVNPDNTAAIFFDFAAAFPSLSRRYLFAALETIGIPFTVTHAIKELYRNNFHYIKLQGVIYPGFTVTAGVRQGCPLSATIFALVTDPLIRYLCYKLPPTVTFRAYADDYALTHTNIYAHLADIYTVFRDFELIAGLKLNLKKCALLILDPIRTDIHRELLRLAVPAWKDIPVVTFTKYLGFFLGVDAIDLSWNLPLNKYDDRIRKIRGKPAGLSLAHALHNIYAITVLSHVGTIYSLPFHRKRRTDLSIIYCTPAPGNWITTDVAAQLSSILPLNSSPRIPSIYIEALNINFADKITNIQSEYEVLIQRFNANDNTPLSMQHPILRDSIIHAIHATKNRILHLKSHHPDVLYKKLKTRRCADLHNHLHQLRHPCATSREYIAKKISRFNPFANVHVLQIIINNITSALRRKNTHQPLIATIFRTWLNAWITGHRFGNAQLCPFCRTYPDKLTHILRCSVSRNLGSLHLGLPSEHSLTFITITDSSKHLLLNRIVHLHILYNTYNYIRHNNSANIHLTYQAFLLKTRSKHFLELPLHFPPNPVLME